MGRHGLDVKGDPRICMVVGCRKKAIYQNAMSRRVWKAKGEAGLRGYCSEHRDRAIGHHEKSEAAQSDYVIAKWYR